MKRLPLSIILVEGVSDLAFVGLFLARFCDHPYTAEGLWELRFKNPLHGKQSAWYKGADGRYALVCAVGGGGDCFGSFYDQYLKPHVQDGKYDCSLVVITDADKDEDEAKTHIALSGLTLKRNQWVEGTIRTDFGNEIAYKTFLRVVPEVGEGSLETVLLNASQAKEKGITESVHSFVDGLDPDCRRHLKKESSIRKAKLGIVVNLIDPQKTFSSLEEIFDSIDLTDESVQETFGFLRGLVC